LDVYFRDNDPRDPHDVNPRIFLHPFDGALHIKHEDLISAYDSEGYINMSDAELERRAKLIPSEGTKGKGFVPEDHSVENILHTFYPNHAWTATARQVARLNDPALSPRFCLSSSRRAHPLLSFNKSTVGPRTRVTQRISWRRRCCPSRTNRNYLEDVLRKKIVLSSNLRSGKKTKSY
jgi:hypothetical protein